MSFAEIPPNDPPSNNSSAPRPTQLEDLEMGEAFRLFDHPSYFIKGDSFTYQGLDLYSCYEVENNLICLWRIELLPADTLVRRYTIEFEEP